MNTPQQLPLQAAIVTGLNILNDPEVRVPASQADGVSALRMLLTALASGQLVVSEPAKPQPVAATEGPAPKPRAPRRTKAEMAQARAAKANGAAAAPTSVQ